MLEGRSMSRSTGSSLLVVRSSGGVLAPPSKRAAMEAVFDARIVCCVDVDTGREGDLGPSGSSDVPRVFSHEGGRWEALLVVDLRRGACVGVLSGVGFSGELLGVVGRAVDGEFAGDCASVLGRRKGEVRALLKESGDGLYRVGVVDCGRSAAWASTPMLLRTMVLARSRAVVVVAGGAACLARVDAPAVFSCLPSNLYR
jgi:hypothetical protein